MKPLSLDEIKAFEDNSLAESYVITRLIHTAKLAWKMKEALEWIAKDRLSSDHYGSEIKEKVDRKISAKQALALWDAE